MEIPESNKHSDPLADEELFGFALFPPVFRIEIAVAGASDRDGNGGRKGFLEDVASAAGVIVRSDDNDAAHVSLGAEFRESAGLFFRVVRIVGEKKHFFFRDAAFDKVMLLEFDHAGAGAEAAAAGDYDRCGALANEFRSAGGAVGVEVVV